MTTNLKPFAVLAKRQEKSEAKRDTDISFLKEVSKYEIEQDQCGAYCAVVPLEGSDNNTISIFEAYDSKDYLMTGHRNGDAYKRFKQIETAEDMLHKPTEVALYTPKFGFVHRSDQPTELLGEQFIWIVRLTAKPGKRNDVLKAARTHTGNVEHGEKETYSFLVLESQDNDVDVLIFERYSSKKYFKEMHALSDSMKEYREKTAPLLEGQESAGFSAVAGFLDKREALH